MIPSPSPGGGVTYLEKGLTQPLTQNLKEKAVDLMAFQDADGRGKERVKVKLSQRLKVKQ